jgi:uncharacterized protein
MPAYNPFLKLKRLKKIIKDLASVVVAFSGGLDSSFLLAVSKAVLKDRVLAVTSASPSFPERELKEAKTFAKRLGVRHLVIETAEFKNKDFLNNPPQRCYYCKQALFACLKEIAGKERIKHVIDGSNKDDDLDFRPGSRAKAKFAVRSPLQEAGLTKSDIRVLSKSLKLSFWSKPSFACLSSRIPYHSRISPQRLKRIERAEDFLIGLGFRQVRVRDFGKLAKIEVEKDKVNKLVTSHKSQVTSRLKRLGYSQVAVDMEGYRSGVFNQMRSRLTESFARKRSKGK